MTKSGFTLIESLIVVMIVGSVSSLAIKNKINENREIESLRFVKEISNVLNAIDHRFAIDGYHKDLWGKKTWSTRKDIKDDLINKQLRSVNSVCRGGIWTPQIDSEINTKLLDCNLLKKQNSKFEMEASFKIDSFDFIEEFNVFVNFKTKKDFEYDFLNIKKSLISVFENDKRELAGLHNFSYVKRNKKDIEITTKECMEDPLNCLIKGTFNREGGKEYIRIDGQNEIIKDHISFVDTLDNSPLKCIKWNKKIINGIEEWEYSQKIDCGIGIYEDSLSPVMVDVSSDIGTFKNVVLDKKCDQYKWNGNAVVKDNTFLKTPCGMTNDGSIVYQVVQNILSKKAIYNDLYANDANFDELEVEQISNSFLNLKELNTKTLNVEVLNVIKELEVQDVQTFKGLVNFKKDIIVMNNASFNVVNLDDITTRTLKVNGDSEFKSLMVDGYFTTNGDISMKSNLNTKSNLTLSGNTNLKGSLSTSGRLLSNEILNADLGLNIQEESVFEKDVKIDNIKEIIFDQNGMPISPNNTIMKVDNIMETNASTANVMMKAPVGNFLNIENDLEFLREESSRLNSEMSKISGGVTHVKLDKMPPKVAANGNWGMFGAPYRAMFEIWCWSNSAPTYSCVKGKEISRTLGRQNGNCIKQKYYCY